MKRVVLYFAIVCLSPLLSITETFSEPAAKPSLDADGGFDGVKLGAPLASAGTVKKLRRDGSTTYYTRKDGAREIVGIPLDRVTYAVENGKIVTIELRTKSDTAKGKATCDIRPQGEKLQGHFRRYSDVQLTHVSTMLNPSDQKLLACLKEEDAKTCVVQVYESQRIVATIRMIQDKSSECSWMIRYAIRSVPYKGGWEMFE